MLTFEVARVSEDDTNKSPCEGAIYHAPTETKRCGWWTIDIKTLDDLMNFIKFNGEIIMHRDRIRIYDTYCE